MLRDYDGQIAEAMVMVRALNKMTKANMPVSVRPAGKPGALQNARPESDLSNKALVLLNFTKKP